MNTSKLAFKSVELAVKRILKEHPEGEDFFDALDCFLTNQITKVVYLELFKQAGSNGLVISGNFGKNLANLIDTGKLPKVPYILYNGGIRKTGQITFLRKSGDAKSYVFLDDSIYGGRTYNALKQYTESTYNKPVKYCVAVYDGCPQKSEDIKSIFRYYDVVENVTPNFIF